ncbi:MAG TPA: glutamate racemase [Candidatus Onthousia faecipullorum]|uniref:Glutamate racemase n=1 Tax=Candidatus Onthousia faecipullorum TaxID=2840887 RepID=A0A9D1GCC2_9FIRM|nr:glutamate racemase [Candidatus Onthousia faecipullorum]
MIGIIDSGIGGGSVLREILKQGINANFIYYSDSKNNPYGDKSNDEVYSIVKNIVNFLLEKGCVAIVIACNTASAMCVKRLREEYPDTLFIAIEPAYKMVHDYNPKGKTLVMATKGTLESEKFLALFNKYDNNRTILLPCSGLAELIEEGNEVKIDRYLDDNLSRYKDIDNVVLGCTHYPLIKDNIRKVLGDIKFFDGSLGVSKELVRQLEFRGITFDDNSYSVEFIDSSRDASKERRFGELLNID